VSRDSHIIVEASQNSPVVLIPATVSEAFRESPIVVEASQDFPIVLTPATVSEASRDSHMVDAPATDAATVSAPASIFATAVAYFPAIAAQVQALGSAPELISTAITARNAATTNTGSVESLVHLSNHSLLTWSQRELLLPQPRKQIAAVTEGI
jgi:hypothetical protein